MTGDSVALWSFSGARLVTVPPAARCWLKQRAHSVSVRGGREAIESVLIVDDSGVQRALAAALRREPGAMQVHEASNGQEALPLLSALPAPSTLLIVDLEMPTMAAEESSGASGQLRPKEPSPSSGR